MLRLTSHHLCWLAALALSLATLMLYTQPAFLVMLAEQVWACL